MPLPNTIQADFLALEPGTLIELYQIDLSLVAGPTLFFHGMPTGGNITFDQNVYVPAAVKASGFDRTTKGSAPRPTFSIANINSAITVYLKTFGAVEGCVFTRIRTLAKYLDAVNGAYATNPDPSQHLPFDIFKIEQKSAESELQVDFTLSMSGDVEGTLLPRRQVMCNSCPWIYRGPDCGYAQSGAGTIFYDNSNFPRTVLSDRGAWTVAGVYGLGDGVYDLINGIRRYFVSLAGSNSGNYPQSNPSWWAPDICKKRVTDCKNRFGQTAPLQFGGFPGTNRLPNV